MNKIQKMGHEVSYHYDVLDNNRGDIERAKDEFKKNVVLFGQNGFETVTVCQHGNPIIERNGYTSNRDFFRNNDIRKAFPKIYDIMVNFQEGSKTQFAYFSDAGRHFQKIFDPLFNDIVKSDDKNIKYKNLNEILDADIIGRENSIISIHPHRWERFVIIYILRAMIFKFIRFVAKILMKIPFFKKIMSKYFYLAKKI